MLSSRFTFHVSRFTFRESVFLEEQTMPALREAPYGSWKSPIISDVIVKGAIGLGQIALDGEDIYWLEGRPQEGGRNVVVRRTPDGRIADVTPMPFNVRTRVHEYGGGAYTVASGTLFFS